MELLSQEVIDLTLKIMEKALKVSLTRKADVVVDFNGTCGYFAVRIYGEGHKGKGSKLTYDYSTYLDFERALEDLNSIYAEVCKCEKA